MLAKSAKQKGKHLENIVADAFREVDQYAYRRADSGSGRLRKEDVFTTLPFFIECKNQKEPHIKSWYEKAEMDTPKEKHTILIYKGDRQRGATVYMRARVFLSIVSKVRIEKGFECFMSMEFSDFMELLKQNNNFT